MNNRSSLPLIGAVLTILAFCLDVRFRISEAASFTVFEIFAWIVGPMILIGSIPARIQVGSAIRSQWAFVGWAAWVFFAGLLSIVFRHQAATIPVWKNSLPSFWLFVIVAGSVRGERDIITLLRALFVGLSLNAALGFGQANLGLPYIADPDVYVSEKLTFSGGHAARLAMGTFGHPNNFGLFIAPGIALAIALTIRLPAYALRAFAQVFILLGLVGLYFSYMKSAFIWITFGVAVTFVPRPLRSPWLIIGSIMTLSLALVFAGLTLGHENRLLTTMTTRTLLWQNAWAMLTSDINNMAFGADPFATAVRAKEFMGWLFPHAHNGFINQALYFGLPAGVLFLVAFGQAIGATNRVGAQRAVADGVLAMILTLSGILPFENLSTTSMLAIPALFSALAFSLSKLSRAKSAAPAVVSAPSRAYA